MNNFAMKEIASQSSRVATNLNISNQATSKINLKKTDDGSSQGL